jgi:hypothetical protein
MTRWCFAVAAIALVGCNKDKGDSGNSEAIPADCDDYISALSDCYEEGGFTLAEGGIDAETWCVDFEESGESTDIFECYIGRIDAGQCGSADGIAATSATFSECHE